MTESGYREVNHEGIDHKRRRQFNHVPSAPGPPGFYQKAHVKSSEEVNRHYMKIYVGTSGYGYREWKGRFYPEKISPKEMLRFYAERFSAAEINNTFYHMPQEGVLSSWAEQVPADFVFAIKAPQVITHLKRLRNAEAEADYFFRALSVLGRKLGPVLFQFPGSFHADYPGLRDFLELVPGLSCAFEFRHISWIDNEILDLLRERGHSFCVADTDEDPADEIISTATWGYLRLRRSDYTDADLSHWIEKIISQKWKKAFVFFKHGEEAKGPDLAMRFCELARSQCVHAGRKRLNLEKAVNHRGTEAQS